MTREEMWEEFENQLIRETRTSMTMNFDEAERMTKLGIKETVAKWKDRLKQEPCEDCISREQAIKATYGFERYTGIDEAPYEYAESILRELPSVRPTRKKERWIPVSERLPEDGELVLFSTNTDRVYEGRFFVDNTDFQWYAFRDEAFAYNNVVTAWLPLPKPYKAESEDEG